MTKYLVVDCANIIFRVWAAQGGGEVKTDEHIGLCMHSVFTSVCKWFNKIKPDKLVFVFEGQHNWRKDIDPKSGKKYKGNRVYTNDMESLFALVKDFKELMEKHSAVMCLSVDRLEGDDVIAGFVQMYSDSNQITILSGDKDFRQLLKHKNVTLIDPATGADRSVDKKTGKVIDPLYFIFEKCIRGDKGDNVMSAYPNVRATKIQKAYEDEAFRINFMNEITETVTGEKYTVGELVAENKILMDLECQPDDLKALMYEAIAKEMEYSGVYNQFWFLKFCGKYKLKQIADELHNFADMFAGKTHKSNNSLLIE
jgi:hypothetical protein